MVIDKERAASRTGIFMIDASKGFLKDGNKNRLRAQDIHKIVNVFNRHTELPRYARMVPVSEIASPDNDYNLNIPRYIDSSEPEDLHDLDAHLNGGIPDRDLDALGAYWTLFPSLRQALFKGNGRTGYSEARVEASQVKTVILGHEEFTAYEQRVAAIFDAWRQTHGPLLRGLNVNALPRAVIHTLSESLRAHFADVPLLDPYALYQRLMDYWDGVMQDDVYLIAADGWVDVTTPRGIIEDKEKKILETPDLIVKRRKYKMDLVSPDLIVARYFAADQAALEALQVTQATALHELEEFVEEHTREGGLLEDATNNQGKVTKGSVNIRLKAIQGELESDDERGALTDCLALIEVEDEAGKAVKQAQATLDQKVLTRYATFTEAQIKTLVVKDKWFASIRIAIEGEAQRLPQQLAGRVKVLEERYVKPLSELERKMKQFGEKVDEHLRKMGVVWA